MPSRTQPACAARGTADPNPHEERACIEDFGGHGYRLFCELDQLCRHVCKRTVAHLGADPTCVDAILDPVGAVVGPEESAAHVWKSPRHPSAFETDYVPPRYVSSSILDNFFYYNHDAACESSQHEQADEKADVRFINNHGAHTDSGLMTAVVLSDEAGLEVFDQKLQHWVAIEKELHRAPNILPRSVAVLFWGDSVVYLPPKCMHSDKRKGRSGVSPCLHRVGKGGHPGVPRTSVVFKQRTAPLRTACRYQEDYHLAACQAAACE